MQYNKFVAWRALRTRQGSLTNESINRRTISYPTSPSIFVSFPLDSLSSISESSVMDFLFKISLTIASSVLINLMPKLTKSKSMSFNVHDVRVYTIEL